MKLTKLPLVAALSLLVLSSNAWAQSTKRLMMKSIPSSGPLTSVRLTLEPSYPMA